MVLAWVPVCAPWASYRSYKNPIKSIQSSGGHKVTVIPKGTLMTLGFSCVFISFCRFSIGCFYTIQGFYLLVNANLSKC